MRCVLYVTNPTPPALLEIALAIPAAPFSQRNRLGNVGSILANDTDNAGYENGRRPKNDVVGISMVAVVGGLCVANGNGNGKVNGNGNSLGFGAACGTTPNPGAGGSAARAGKTPLNLPYTQTEGPPCNFDH